MEIVSVCLPLFNGGKFLQDALRSLENQTYKDFTLYISDDGSIDDSFKICEDFQKTISFDLKLYKNSGLGIAGNCNFLANKAKGKYLKFLFQDDLLEPYCIESFVSNIKKYEDVSFAFSDRDILFENRSNQEC